MFELSFPIKEGKRTERIRKESAKNVASLLGNLEEAKKMLNLSSTSKAEKKTAKEAKKAEAATAACGTETKMPAPLPMKKLLKKALKIMDQVFDIADIIGAASKEEVSAAKKAFMNVAEAASVAGTEEGALKAIAEKHMDDFFILKSFFGKLQFLGSIDGLEKVIKPVEVEPAMEPSAPTAQAKPASRKPPGIRNIP